ncbi:MAG: hypothetical protein ACOCVN_02735, partial [bacterium]
MNKIIFASCLGGVNEVGYDNYPKRVIMNRFLLSFVFLLSLLFAFSGPEAYAQEREGGKDPKDPVLKGQRGILLDLDDEYCSESTDDLIQIPDTEIPGDAVSVRWVVTTNYGDGLEHPDYIENASGGTIPGSSIYFKPSAVDSIYWYNTRVFLQYYFVNDEGFDTGTTKYDYTFVRRSPWVFDLTANELEICEGDNATLTLSGSEPDYEYLLFRNGVEIETQAKPGSGSPLNFTAGLEGEYTVQAVRTDGIVCAETMDGSPYITVHPNPTPDPISNGPVCQGENIVLEDNAPEVSGYVYTWFGPGLPVGGENGHTVTVNDNATINTATTHTYTLTISDGNFSTSCETSATVDVIVNERPEVAPTVDPVCEGGTATLNANPSGGSGNYSFSWTSNPAGFTSTDENP